jgi:hypothetical protein
MRSLGRRTPEVPIEACAGTKSVGTKVSEAAAGLTLLEWVRDVLLASYVDAGTMAAERAILAEMLAMRAILLNFMLKLSMASRSRGR